MEKVVLIDGNNLIFRSFYATAYTGNIMRNSKGLATNALYGLCNMLLKIEKEEKPDYVLVAFDKGKTFRHEMFDDYKDGRSETPDDLKKQMPIARDLVSLMGYTALEIDNYEADDIIGTFARKIASPEIDTLIISSDKDLLQLVNENVRMKLLKSKDHIYIDSKNFKDYYPFDPVNIIDLKALMGDSSDNIKGVQGVGEKTALKLLTEYHNLDNIYASIDNIKGKLKERLIEGRKDAYDSFNLATIVTDINMPVDLNIIKKTPVSPRLMSLLDELEFNSLKTKFKTEEEVFDFEVLEKDALSLDKDFSIYPVFAGSNYHFDKASGYMIYDGEKHYFLKTLDKFKYSARSFTYDYKKLLVLSGLNLDITFDLEIALYIDNENITDDISSYMIYKGSDVPLLKEEYGTGKSFKMPEKDIVYKNAAKRSKFIYDESLKRINNLNDEIFKMEMKLSKILANMEVKGIKVDQAVLEKIGKDIDHQLEDITHRIYTYAGEEFNISSPMQLGTILFEKIGLPYPRKVKNNKYSTSRDILDKVRNKHPVIDYVIDYRTLTKLKSTYVDALIEEIHDNHIHTTYNQCLTRTGRLSSSDPNLQNIPEHNEYGRLIKKAFIPEEGYSFLSCDYSQIELRVFASMSKDKEMIKAFKEGDDIHKRTASVVFKKDIKDVSSEERYLAKAVNFGMIYGISSFGLSEDLNINISEAKKFMDEYLKSFPLLKDYMDSVIRNAKDKGYVYTLMNRKRLIPELTSSNFMVRKQGERMALNTPIQGTAADILKLAMIDIDEAFSKENLKSYMTLQVHDELIFNVYNGEEEKVERIVKDKMENAFKLLVPLKVAASSGNNLYEI